MRLTRKKFKMLNS